MRGDTVGQRVDGLMSSLAEHELGRNSHFAPQGMIAICSRCQIFACMHS